MLAPRVQHFRDKSVFIRFSGVLICDHGSKKPSSELGKQNDSGNKFKLIEREEKEVSF